jgi:hypothetical protein
VLNVSKTRLDVQSEIMIGWELYAPAKSRRVNHFATLPLSTQLNKNNTEADFEKCSI